jgi:hypothetical protein
VKTANAQPFPNPLFRYNRHRRTKAALPSDFAVVCLPERLQFDGMWYRPHCWLPNTPIAREIAMTRPITLLVAAMALSFVPTTNAAAGLFWWSDSERCQPEGKTFLRRLNEVPALVVLCPGTEVGLLDRVRFPDCVQIGCEKCSCKKNFLCQPKYIRFCRMIQGRHCSGESIAPKLPESESPLHPEADDEQLPVTAE